MDLVKFKQKDISVAIMVPAITDVLPDGRFWTRSLSRGCDSFGTDQTLQYFTRSNPEERWQQELITPKTDYEKYELTSDPAEADMIAISYYMGTDFKKVVKSLGDRKFIVGEKLKIESVTEEVNETTGFKDKLPYHDNNILKYRGLKHHDKPIDEIDYEGDCNTEIQLHDDCSFKMYKFLGIQKKV